MSHESSLPRDYLYVDARRLDTYFNQIADPVAYDKVPTLKIGISLAGLIAEGHQARMGRLHTTHEKVMALISHLKENGLASEEETGRRSKTEFRIVTLEATRALLPTKTVDGVSLSGFGLWIATQDIGSLYVIEDSQLDDRPGARMFSGYSALHLLLDELEQEQRRFLVVQAARNDWSDMPSRSAQRFSREPISFLRSLGATILTSRRVTVLYRVRASCADLDSQPPFRSAVVGYAIAIWTD